MERNTDMTESEELKNMLSEARMSRDYAYNDQILKLIAMSETLGKRDRVDLVNYYTETKCAINNSRYPEPWKCSACACKNDGYDLICRWCQKFRFEPSQRGGPMMG